MSILVLPNPFVCIKTPIQYKQQSLLISGYPQTLCQAAVVGHPRATKVFVGHETDFMSHKSGSGTPVAHNGLVERTVGAAA